MTTWTNSALCAQTDPELWHSDTTYDQHIAKTICGRCPVRTTCLNTALALEGHVGANLRHGIWGGTNRTERYRLWQEAGGAIGLARADEHLAPCGSASAQRRHHRRGETCRTCNVQAAS